MLYKLLLLRLWGRGVGVWWGVDLEALRADWARLAAE